MYPNFSPIKLTIVDFLGVFLPGIVWTILVLTLWGMLSYPHGVPPITNSPTTFTVNPLTVTWFLSTGKNSFLFNNKGEEFSLAFYLSLTFISVLFGYLNMAFSTIPAECIASFLCKINPFRKKPKINDLFPYNEYFKKRSYYKKLVAILVSELELSYAQISELPTTYHPFETCKRILKIRQFPLWEDAQYREAQVRMIGSLLLASLVNLGLAIVQLLTVRQNVNLTWLIVSLIIIFILAFTFRYRRFREVEDVYISTLLVTSQQRR